MIFFHNFSKSTPQVLELENEKKKKLETKMKRKGSEKFAKIERVQVEKVSEFSI